LNLNESIVEDAALILPAATLTRPLPWGEGKELGYAVGHGPLLAPGEPAAERESFSEVVQSRFPRTLTPGLSQRERRSARPSGGWTWLSPRRRGQLFGIIE